MGNCLVTKLKENVDNNNITKIDHVRVTVSQRYCIGSNTSDLHIKSVNNNSLDYTYTRASGYVYTEPSVENTIIDIDNKYDINIVISKAEVELEQFKYSPLTVLLVSGNNPKGLMMDIANIFYSAVEIKEITVKNTTTIFGDIACFSGKIGNASFSIGLDLSYSPNITGDAAVFLEAPNRTTSINIIGSGITLTQETLTALQEKGYTVNYTQSQIID